MATKAMAGAGAGAQLGARRQRVSAKSARSARSSRELAMRSKAEGSGSGQGNEPDNPPTFDENWLQASPVVFGASFLGWIIPASIPTPAINNGDSLVSVRSLASLLSFSSLSRGGFPCPHLSAHILSQAFSKAIAKGLTQFPNPPPVTDELWLYMVLFHAPLFTIMLLGQIGVQGRKKGYFR
jgi:photosystem I protein PsaO